QRENRLALRRFARGRARAANCFSYSGGFSVSAVLGGAREVVSIDRDAAAIRLARRNFELNGIDPAKHRFVAADVLEFLRGDHEPFDLIVLDPPAFAKSQRAVPAALDGYASLHRAALEALVPGGILATASCSARVSPDEFTGAIREAAAKTHAQLQLLEEKRQPAAHPGLLAFPEGSYLQFFVFRNGYCRGSFRPRPRAAFPGMAWGARASPSSRTRSPICTAPTSICWRARTWPRSAWSATASERRWRSRPCRNRGWDGWS